MNSPIMRSLLWKDAKSLWPLLIAACAGVFAINLIAAIGSWWTEGRLVLETHVAIWIFIPNLVALGAPAMLVGGEEESGTLAWLRTLPVAWQKVVDSKLIVSIAAWLVTWVLSTLVLSVFYVACDFRNTALVNDLTNSMGVSYMLFFGAVLLLYGFVMAYTFRSPITGLVILLFTVPFIHVFSAVGLSYMLVGVSSLDHWELSGISNYRWLVGIGAGVGFLFVLWMVQRLLGRRRLTSPAPRRLITEKVQQARSAYRPPSTVGLDRPSLTKALHWQHFRQAGWPVIVLTMIGVFGGLLFGLSESAGRIASEQSVLIVLAELSPIFIVASTMWLGTLVFYGDSVRRRCAFFADRGISPAKIWWTRMLIPALGCLLIALTVLLSGTRSEKDLHLSVLFVLSPFALGQLISLWMKRPILSFIATPAYGGICALFYAMFFSQYVDYWWTTIALFPILLLATYLLCERWLAGKIDFGFHLRVIAFTAAAILVPILGTIAYRVATIPTLDTAFHARANAELEKYRIAAGNLTDEERSDGLASHNVNAYGWGDANMSGAAEFEIVFKDWEALFAAIEEELQGTQPIGHCIEPQHIAYILTPMFDMDGLSTTDVKQVRRDAMKIALSWVHRIRSVVANHAADYSSYQMINLASYQESAETIESTVINQLRQNGNQFGNKKDVAEIVALLASKEERNAARRALLLHEWKRFNAPPSIKGIDRHGLFANSLLHNDELFGIEAIRSNRNLDAYVKHILNELDNGFPPTTAEYLNRRNSRWKEIFSSGTASRRAYRDDFLTTWNRDYEKQIKALRKTYATKTSDK